MAGTSPAMTAVGDGPSFRGLRDRRVASEVYHPKCCANALGGAVLEADHRVDRYRALSPIDGVDDVGVFFVDDATADLARARELAVVGVELLVEQQKSGNALRRWQRGVDGLDLVLQQLID